MYSKVNIDTQITNQITSALRGDYYINEGGKVQAKLAQGSFTVPWIFVNYEMRKKHCDIWNGVYCVKFGLIPTFCRTHCWKTVFKPRNVKETFECYEILKKIDLPSKIGMDTREYTHGAWAGFVYGDSLAQGKEYYKIVRSKIPEDIPVILKRGCTEMEVMKPSNKWHELTPKDIALEERLDDIFDFSENNFFQAGWLKNEIKMRWIKRAIAIGDPTAKETAEKYTGDPDIWSKLVAVPVTYHDGR